VEHKRRYACPYGGHHLGRKKIRNAQFTKNAPYKSVLFNKVKKTVKKLTKQPIVIYDRFE